MTYHLLFDGMVLPENRLKLAALLSVIAGGVKGPASEYLLSAKGIALRKANGSLRPIEIHEILYRLVASILARRVAGDAGQILKPVQLAVGVAAGCEIGVARHQAVIYNKAKLRAALYCDYEGAFNHLSTHEMLRELLRHDKLKPIWRFAFWAYTNPVTVYLIKAGKVVARQTSVNGARQGCPLGGLLFAIGSHPVLLQIKAKFPDVEIVAFMDDVTIFVVPRDVELVWALLGMEAKNRGLILQKEKCALGWYHEEALPHALVEWLRGNGIAVVKDGQHVLLGAPVGTNKAKMAEFAMAQVREKDTVFDILQDPSLLTAVQALELLRVCMLESLSYLCRTTAPDVTAGACQAFDARVLHTFRLRSGLTDAQVQEHLARIRLPIKEGGHGIKSTALQAPALFLAGQGGQILGWSGAEAKC
jgi:hypothetical protein